MYLKSIIAGNGASIKLTYSYFNLRIPRITAGNFFAEQNIFPMTPLEVLAPLQLIISPNSGYLDSLNMNCGNQKIPLKIYDPRGTGGPMFGPANSRSDSVNYTQIKQISEIRDELDRATSFKYTGSKMSQYSYKRLYEYKDTSLVFIIQPPVTCWIRFKIL